MLNDIRGLMNVFEYLLPEEVVCTAQFVSKHWKEVARKDEIWENHLSRLKWSTNHFVYDLVEMPAIERFVINTILLRNPRCLFSSYNNINYLYSVDQDKKILVNLPFETSTASWVYTPNDHLVITGCGTEGREAWEVALESLQAQRLERMHSPHRDHASLICRGGLLVTGGSSSTICELWKSHTWHHMPSLPAPRAQHAMVSVGLKVYVVGGAVPDICVLEGDKWTTLDFSLPYAVILPSLKYYHGKIMVIGGADENSRYRKFILEIDLVKEETVNTGVVLYAITRSNSISRQGENLMLLDYNGHVKHLRRPVTFSVPHSQFLHLFTEGEEGKKLEIGQELEDVGQEPLLDLANLD